MIRGNSHTVEGVLAQVDMFMRETDRMTSTKTGVGQELAKPKIMPRPSSAQAVSSSSGVVVKLKLKTLDF